MAGAAKNTEGYKPIQDYILAALVKMIKVEFDLDAKWSQTYDYADVFKKIKPEERTDKEFAALKITQFTVNDSQDGHSISGSVRPHALAHKGVIGGVTKKITIDGVDQPHRAHIIKAVPVNIALTFAYMSVDTATLMRMFRRWAFAYQNRRLSFNLNYLGSSFSCQVELNAELALNDRQQKGEQIPYFIYEGQITIGGFMTNPDDARDTGTRPVLNWMDLDVEVHES